MPRLLPVLLAAGLAHATPPAITREQIAPARGPHSQPPLLGFGTWMLDPKTNCTEAVVEAVLTGYRHFDAATAYQNQECVGKGLAEGIRRAGIKREDLWVTSKLWSTRHGSKIASGLEVNLQQLGLDYLDLTLMHFPVGTANGKPEYDIIPTWREMEKLVSANNAPQKGRTRFIGVSNFNLTQLEELLAAAKIPPKVHQIELHPYLQQNAFVEAHRKAGVPLTAYAPLGDTNPAYRAGGLDGGRYMRPGHPPPLLSNTVLVEIGAARGCTPAQVALKWGMLRSIPVHPRAARVSHQRENFDAYKCPLRDEDLRRIADIEKAHKFRMWDPCPKQLGLPCYLGLEGGNESQV